MVEPIIINMTNDPRGVVNQIDPDFLQTAHYIQSQNPKSPAVVFFFGSKFVSNCSLVIARAFADYLIYHGISCAGGGIGDSRGYAKHIGFFRGLGSEMADHRPSTLGYMDLERISPEDTQVAERVRNLLEQFSDRSDVIITEEALDILTYSVGELISNVRRHSRFSGRVSFQYYKGAGAIEITVCDCGIGIVDALRQAGYEGNDEEILSKSIQKEVTSSTAGGLYTEASPGVGLYNVSRLAQMNNKAFVIISTKRQELLVSRENPVESPSIRYMDGFFPGTIVVIRVPNRIRTGLTQVLSETNDSLQFFS